VVRTEYLNIIQVNFVFTELAESVALLFFFVRVRKVVFHI
jgi:hypothetical protein